MTKLYLVGDLHLGHRNIHKQRTQFATAEEHHEFVLKELYSTITKYDVVMFMGDTLFDLDYANELRKLPAKKKKLILGNHDCERFGIENLIGIYDEIHSAMSMRNCWFTHIPIHPGEFRNRKYNIHAHLHEKVIDDHRYINVSLEQNDLKPITYEQAIRRHELHWNSIGLT